MLRKKNLILIGIINIICLGSCFAQNSNWTGVYEYVETGMNAGGNRSYSVEYYLDIFREDIGLTAIYNSGENGTVYQKMLLDVKVKGHTAYFYYLRCMEKDDSTEERCEDTEKKGTLMFKLVKKTGAKGKIILLTYGVKNDSLPKGEVFFKRVGKSQFN